MTTKNAWILGAPGEKTKTAVAGEALYSGDIVYVSGGTSGKEEIVIKPTSAATAAKACWVVVQLQNDLAVPEYNRTYNSGARVRIVNGCDVRFNGDCTDIAQDFTSSVAGDALGLTNSGLITKTGAAAASTTGFFRLKSFMGDTNSGIMDVHVANAI